MVPDGLAPATLGRLAASIERPRYDRTRLSVGIVHLGLGAFHRAHQAVYTEDALEAAPGRFGICGVSLRSAAVRDRLAPQDGLYTIVARGAGAERLRVVGCLKEVLVGPEDPAAVVRRIADPKIAIVSLTVTEKGYCHDPATGALDADHPDIRHDLEQPERPRTRDRHAGRRPGAAPPLGRAAADRALLRQPAAQWPDPARRRAGIRGPPGRSRARAAGSRPRSRSPAPWSTGSCRPRPTRTSRPRGAARSRTTRRRSWREPFRQWVIEDRFTGPRPRLGGVGAELVADVAAYEEMKLRLLNGSHSTLAYLGWLAGFEHVSEVMQAPDS